MQRRQFVRLLTAAVVPTFLAPSLVIAGTDGCNRILLPREVLRGNSSDHYGDLQVSPRKCDFTPSRKSS